MKLTKRSVEAARFAGGTDYRWDDNLQGLGLRLYPSGQKSFVVSFRARGRKRIMVLGKYGPLTCEVARQRALKILAAAADGQDPARQRRERKQEPTMRDLAKRYLEDHAWVKKKPVSAKEDERMWRQRVLPALGSAKVAHITRANVDRFHSSMRSTPYTANRVLALLSKAFNLAEVWGWRPDGSNPCRHVKRFKEEKRERFLSPAELARLGEALARAEREQTETVYTVAAIRLLLFTGCRLSEILHLRWRDVDIERGCLHLPDSKTGRRTVYLNPPAIQLLRGLERSDDNPHVIQGKKVGSHLVNLTLPWKRIRKRADLEDVRIHDLRHTYASFGAAAGLSLPIIGKMLGHTQAATTQRYAHLASAPVQRAAEVVGAGIEAALAAGAEVASEAAVD